MQNSNSEKVIAAATTGMMALVGKQVFLRVLSVLSGIVLARWLSPEAFGVYAISLFVMSLIGCFSDVGFALGFIRCHKEPPPEELQAFFSFQFLLVGSMTSTLIFFANPVGTFLGIPSEDIWTLKVFLILSFLHILISPSQIILQRKLAFGVLARIQVCTEVVYCIVAITAAVNGLGLKSFVLALASKTLVNIMQILLAYPFPIRLNFRFRLLKPYLTFGLAGHGTNLILSMQNYTGSAIVGSIQGAASAGYFNFAMSYTMLPNSLIEALRRANFSYFSRLQDNRAELSFFFSKIIRVFFLIGVPIAIFLVFWAPRLIEAVYSSKWLPALPAIYALVGYSLLRFLIDPVIGLFLALGYSKDILVSTSMWGVGTIVIALPLVHIYGLTGMAVGFSLGAVIMVFLVIFKVAEICQENLFKTMKAPILGGIVMATFLFGTAEYFNHDVLSKIVASTLGVGLLGGTLFLIDRSEIKNEILQGVQIIRKLKI